jgi:hypothetical protein
VHVGTGHDAERPAVDCCEAYDIQVLGSPSWPTTPGPIRSRGSGRRASHPPVDETIVERWAADERDEIGPDVVDAALLEMNAAGRELARGRQPVAAAFARRARPR